MEHHTEHGERVRAWLAEEGDGPTPFGEAVNRVCRARGTEAEWLQDDLSPEHSDALRDHCDGVEGADKPPGLPRAVALAVGLDPDTATGRDRDALMVLARAWTFNEVAFGEPSKA